jgi:hypothetical protein
MSFSQMQRLLVCRLPRRADVLEAFRGIVSRTDLSGLFENDEAIGFQ